MWIRGLIMVLPLHYGKTSTQGKNPSSPPSTDPLIYPSQWTARKQSYTKPAYVRERPSYPRRTQTLTPTSETSTSTRPVMDPTARSPTLDSDARISKNLHQVSKIISHNSISPVSANVLTNNAASLPALQPHRRKKGNGLDTGVELDL